MCAASVYQKVRIDHESVWLLLDKAVIQGFWVVESMRKWENLVYVCYTIKRQIVNVQSIYSRDTLFSFCACKLDIHW